MLWLVRPIWGYFFSWIVIQLYEGFSIIYYPSRDSQHLSKFFFLFKRDNEPIKIDSAVVKSDDTSQLFDDELARTCSTAHESETDIISIFIRGDNGRDKRIGSSILVYVWSVNTLWEFRLFVVLILRVDADSGRSGFRRISFILCLQYEKEI